LTASGAIYNPNIASGNGIVVAVDNNGKLVKATSSLRYKNNVEDLSAVADSEQIISQSRPVVFEYKNQPGAKVYGLIAEETENIDKNLVDYKDGVVDAIHYLFYIPVLINEVKRIPALVARIEELESKLGQQQL
jgi:hypothetical protein